MTPKSEIKMLRRAQTIRVMPLIGQLLDAWELMDNDTKGGLREDAPSLTETLDEIRKAMEE